MPSGAGRLARGAVLEKGRSEAPAIDQKFMSVTGIRPACPLLAFMSCRGRHGRETRRTARRRGTGPSPGQKATQGHSGANSVTENRQMCDQSAQIALHVTHYWLPLRGTEL